MKAVTLVSAAVLLHGDRVLLTRRPPEAPLGGLWEFPGGKLEDGESPEEALSREIREELGIGIRDVEPFCFSYFEYPDRRVLLLTFLASPVAEPAGAAMPWGWRRVAEIVEAEMPPADAPILARLRLRVAGP